MRLDQLNMLLQTPVFGGVRDDVLATLVDKSRSRFVAKGEFFFHEKDAADSMFVLENGEVAVIKESDGQEYLLRKLQPGDCFGEMALIDLYPRSASVVAMEDSTAIELTTASLYEIYKRDLEQFVIIQMNLGREISRRLRDADRTMFRAKIVAKQVNGDYLFTAA